VEYAIAKMREETTMLPVIEDTVGRQFACFPAAILVFLINPKEEMLFLAYSRQNNTWGIVKGAIENGETIKQAALRETKEEVGAQVQVESVGVVHAASVYHDKKVPNVISVFYLMAYRGGKVQPGDDMAKSQFQWWTLKDIVENRINIVAPNEQWIIQRAIDIYRLWKK
jgi:ADP-ribose pyrophosphatase YjhB (NUDIX family)